MDMSTPTTENTTHDPDDAPAEGGASFTISVENLERVREYDDLRSLLGAFSATAQLHAEQHPGDPDAQGIAAIVKAIEIAHRHPDDPDSQALIKKLAGKADHYMRREPLRGPRTPEQQADMLCNTVAYGLKSDPPDKAPWNDRQIAERFVMQLRIAPDIAKHTWVPAPAQVPADEWRDSDAEADAVFAVEKAIAEKLKTADAEAITKAALRALGCPTKTAQNFYR